MFRSIVVFILTSVLAFAQSTPWAPNSFKQPYSGTVQSTQGQYNQRIVSVFDWMPILMQADVKARTQTIDCTAAIQAAFTNTPVGVTINFPYGTYKVSGSTPITRAVSGDLYFDTGVLVDASGFSGSYVFQLNGSRGTYYVNTAAIAKGDRSITVNATLAATLAAGDEIQISTDRTSGGNGDLWNGGQNVFYKGEFLEVKSVAGSVVSLKTPTRDAYSASSAVVAKVTPVTSIITGLTIKGSNNQSTDQVGLAINYGRDIKIYGGRIDGFSWAALQLARCLNVSVSSFTCSSSWFSGMGMGYGMQSATSQKVFVSNCNLQAGRNAFDVGGWEPSRDVYISNSYLGTDQDNQRALGTHGNSENITVSGCVIEGSLILQGKQQAIDGCDIYTNYPLILTSDWTNSTYTASFATNVMTLTVAGTGASAPAVGQTVTASGVTAGTTITGLLSGTINGVGSTYSLSTSPGTLSARTVTGTYQGWTTGGVYHSLRNNRIYSLDTAAQQNVILAQYSGTVDRLVIEGNQFYGGAAITQAIVQIDKTAGAYANPTITDFVFDGNDLYTTGTGAYGILFTNTLTNNVKIRSNNFRIPVKTHLYWSTAGLSNNIEIVNNQFTSTTVDSGLILCPNSGAARIRYNGNIYTNTNTAGQGAYYAMTMNASQNIELTGNTWNNMKNRAVDAVAPQILYADNTRINVTGTDGLLGKVSHAVYANGTTTEGAGSALPTAGVFALGDRWLMSTGTVGQPKSYQCTTAGGAKSLTRANTTAYTKGQWVLWTTGTTISECTTAGTSGTGTAAPTTVGQVVTDGTAVFTCRSLTTVAFTSEGNL